MYDSLHNAITLVVDEWQDLCLRVLHKAQGELIVIHQTNFFNLVGIVDVVEKNRVGENFGFLKRRDLDGSRTDLE